MFVRFEGAKREDPRHLFFVGLCVLKSARSGTLKNEQRQTKEKRKEHLGILVLVVFFLFFYHFEKKNVSMDFLENVGGGGLNTTVY